MLKKIKLLLKSYWLLVAILLLAAVLRLWKLGTIPPHLTQDEAALGYNAYSILKTGRDEYGTLLPIIFKSFGDYKPGFYVYLAAPSVAVFGLNEFAVRLPSALAGVIAVWLIYLIVHQLFGYGLRVTGSKKLTRNALTPNSITALTASLLLAINPWHIYFSRGGWEANVSLTLTLAGVYFFLKLQQKSKYLYLSAIFFAATLLTYQGAKLATPLVVVALGLSYVKKLLVSPRKVLVGSVILGLAISFPIILSLFQGKTGRLEVFSVFSYPRPVTLLQDFLNEGNEKVGGITYYLFHSEKLNFARGILGRWFNHFSGRFLFFEGDWQNPKHSAPNQGMLLIGDAVLLIFGLIALFREKGRSGVYFIFLWLALAPLPAALSRDQVQAIRAFNLSIPLVLIASLGLAFLLTSIKSLSVKWLRVTGYVLLVIGYSASFVYFLDAYFVHFPVHNAKYWEYGYKQVAETVTPIQKNYQAIKVEQSYAQPYIYFLFFQKYDPAKYQKQAHLTESEYKDVGLVGQLDNIYFVPIDWAVNRGEKGTLFVAGLESIPREDSQDTNLFRLITEIKYPNEVDVAYRIIEVE